MFCGRAFQQGDLRGVVYVVSYGTVQKEAERIVIVLELLTELAVRAFFDRTDQVSKGIRYLRLQSLPRSIRNLLLFREIAVGRLIYGVSIEALGPNVIPARNVSIFVLPKTKSVRVTALSRESGYTLSFGR
mgnify:CR=1 FL=1